MASRKSGSDFHTTGPFCYLDDVPFKIGEKFRSPAKVGLPIGFCLRDCSQFLLEAQYDFSLESKVVEWAKKLKEMKAELALAKAKREGDRGLGFSDGPCPTVTSLPINPVLASLKHNSILTPTPVASGAIKQKLPSPPCTKANFNLADFECEDDPFDKLELKTLNDREELKNILQLHASAGVPLLDVSSLPKAGSDLVEALAPTEQAELDLKPLHKPNGLVSIPQLENCEKVSLSSKVSLSPIMVVSNIKSLSFPKLDADDGEQRAARLTSTFHSTFYSSLKNCSQSKPASLNGHHLSAASVRSALILDNGMATAVSPLPRHPVLPAVSMAGTEVLPSSHNTVTLPATQNHLGLITGLPETTCSTKVSSGSTYTDLFQALSPSKRQCVNTVVGMGYSYESAIKATEKQGQNVEQVLDYLLTHGQLCERGFDPALVEEGMEMYQCSEKKTIEFLQLVCKFREMGFEQKDIKEVLLLYSNDQEKALEDLMARAGAT
uniref:Ubiquitin associated protein 1 n=1 Tax=Latimeria chalumnae TaxID=7897 RepID=H3A5B3_LATCH|nr:PREDICTED: ubiquitin-associated protein 1 [Latimeria chalumnae]XP_014354151.1 PREDICTED: ubiquitin-associated protein 1 [Latimeria chalumnae]|eukprot:XP_006012679.1 PREDICTED: ubiquitin-associated protein 1 [Latimeria chalumnae]